MINMNNAIIQHSGNCLPMHSGTAYLYGEFTGANQMLQPVEGSELNLKHLASVETKLMGPPGDQYLTGHQGAEILFKVTTKFNRQKINPNAILNNSKGLEEYLGEAEFIDLSHAAVKNVALEIKSKLPQGQRNNPYAIMNGIVHWISGNIEPIFLPIYFRERVMRTIEALPEGQRHDSHTILRSMGIFKEEYDVREITNSIKLPMASRDPGVLAKEFTEQLGSTVEYLQLYWIRAGSVNASTTIENKAGKCVCVANTYAALARTFGVPSRVISGLHIGELDMLGLRLPSFTGHVWAASYMQPYGWVEVEPRKGPFDDSDYHTHAYETLKQWENIPNFTLIEKGVDRQVLAKATQLLEKEKLEVLKEEGAEVPWWKRAGIVKELRRTLFEEELLSFASLRRE